MYLKIFARMIDFDKDEEKILKDFFIKKIIK